MCIYNKDKKKKKKEHSTADREVPGSNPGAPSFCFSMRVFRLMWIRSNLNTRANDIQSNLHTKDTQVKLKMCPLYTG